MQNPLPIVSVVSSTQYHHALLHILWVIGSGLHHPLELLLLAVFITFAQRRLTFSAWFKAVALVISSPVVLKLVSVVHEKYVSKLSFVRFVIFTHIKVDVPVFVISFMRFVAHSIGYYAGHARYY